MLHTLPHYFRNQKPTYMSSVLYCKEFYMIDARDHESTCQSQLLHFPMHHQTPWFKDHLLHLKTKIWRADLSNILEDDSLSQQCVFMALIQQSFQVNFPTTNNLHPFSLFLQSNLPILYL